jgi:hypothetical protein
MISSLYTKREQVSDDTLIYSTHAITVGSKTVAMFGSFLVVMI